MQEHLVLLEQQDGGAAPEADGAVATEPPNPANDRPRRADAPRPSAAGHRPAPPQTSQLVFVSPSGKRAQPRVSLPMTVVIGQAHHRAEQWSIGGFGLGGQQLRMALGTVFSATLILHFNAFDCSIAMTCKAVRCDKHGYAVGFKYVDPAPEQIQILRHLVEEHLAGEVISIGGIIGIIDRVGGGARITHPLARGAAARIVRAVVRLTVYLALLLVAATGAVAATATVLTERATYAAVTTGIAVVRTPGNGVLAGEARAPGTAVAKDECSTGWPRRNWARAAPSSPRSWSN